MFLVLLGLDEEPSNKSLSPVSVGTVSVLIKNSDDPSCVICGF